MRKLIAFILTATLMVVVLSVATKQPVPQGPQVNPQVQPFPPGLQHPAPNPTLEQAKNNISEERIRDSVSFLCDPALAGRMSGQSGNVKAAQWVADRFKEYGLEPGVNDSYFQTFNIQNLNEAKERGNGQTSNVIGILKGGTRCIVIGAHVDHIGYGPSMSRAPNRREIHPGADDNASSVAALLEIAKAFTSLKGQNKHTVIFIAFSAEEMGLLGANHYVNNPVISLSQVDFMLNMDMIGRMKSTVDFMGAGSIPEFKQAAQKVGGSINTNKSAGGGSDHASFARKGIPVTFVHTGLHNEYHTPDDTPDRLNFRGIRDISQWVFYYCWLLDSVESFPRVMFVPEGTWRDHDWEGK